MVGDEWAETTATAGFAVAGGEIADVDVVVTPSDLN
jgi:hypothetical protein